MSAQHCQPWDAYAPELARIFFDMQPRPVALAVDAALLRPTLCLSSLGVATGHTFGGTATAPGKVHTNKLATLLADGVTGQMVDELMGPAMLTGNLATSSATWHLSQATAAQRVPTACPQTGPIRSESGQERSEMARSNAALDLVQQCGKVFGTNPHPHQPRCVSARQSLFKPVASPVTAKISAVSHHNSSAAQQAVHLERQGLAMAQVALAAQGTAALTSVSAASRSQAQPRRQASRQPRTAGATCAFASPGSLSTPLLAWHFVTSNATLAQVHLLARFFDEYACFTCRKERWPACGLQRPAHGHARRCKPGPGTLPPKLEGAPATQCRRHTWRPYDAADAVAETATGRGAGQC